jgi:glycosyltransferase involved in cell wall biosynthesis
VAYPFGRIPIIALKRSFEWHILSIAMRLATAVIAIDKSSRDMITSHFPGKRVEFIPNPIDFSQIPDSATTDNEKGCVLFLGWIIPSKGIEELIASWAAISQRKWILKLVGPGDQRYNQKLSLCYNPQNLEFLEEVGHDEAMRLMVQSDIFVLPSHTEGFPNVILEAMSMGKAIIATSVGAIPEMLADQCGIVIPSRNIEELKNALELLIQNKFLRTILGENARNKVQRSYSIDNIFPLYLSLWQDLAIKK